MSELFNPLTIPFLMAMFLAVNMGASGTSPSFSAAYGAGVLKKTLIPGLFGIMVLLGALIAGKEVSMTLGKGLLDQSFFTPKVTTVILFSVSVSLLLANLLGVPQSTSQATVLSIAGAAIALDGLNSQKLMVEIIPTWFILPIISFILMLIFCKWLLPAIKSKIKDVKPRNIHANRLLRGLLISSSLYVAFSIGANNVANAAAPIASLTTNETGLEQIGSILPIIIMSVLIVSPCFAIGSSLMGHKVTKTTGKDIVSVSPFNATIIAFMVASLLILASVSRGIPTSLVQLNGAAFIALSISKKGVKKTVSNKTVKQFFCIWAIAPMASFILTYLLISIIVP